MFTNELILEILKYTLPVMAVIVLLRCVRSMLSGKTKNETWGYLHADRKTVPIKHWENLIGRSGSADVKLMNPQVSRVHAVLIRSDSGNWRIFDIFSKGGVYVNNAKVRASGTPVNDNDILTFGNASLRFRSVTEEQKAENEALRQSFWRQVHPAITLLYLTIMQAILLAEHCITAKPEHVRGIVFGFVMLALLEWLCYFFMRSIRRTGFEVELLAFFLTSFGLSVIASSAPEEMLTQTIQICLGVAAFFILGAWLRDLERTKTFRLPIACIALALLAATMIFGEEKYGAKLWFTIGGMSVQPAELVKVAFIYVGAETLERLFRTKNLFVFIAFSALCVIFLALMSDFGTALIFFVTFLIISFMRSGSVATVALAVAGAAMAGFLMFTIKPHVKQRFSAWGHVWDDVFDRGYQQTHAMSAGAGGGLFGKGAGNGWLKDGFAANSDTVFCMLCEELGLIIAICAVLAILALSFFAVRSSSRGRSAYYSIAACASASMFMVQMALNVFGTVDILPFTGVTFPFVSRGGTSLLSCWMLLAFIKAGDTRKGASFVVKAPGFVKEAASEE
ncbi:MAG: FtsW/RodA/SpoVE family cell cycle protein [Oscillospiraceae bacterium]|nr:FtsW/RodA/SpoVE family cell cycle protein [Oscillospiraceae bacterium]